MFCMLGQKMSRSRCSKLSGTETIRGMCEHLLTKKLFRMISYFVVHLFISNHFQKVEIGVMHFSSISNVVYCSNDFFLAPFHLKHSITAIFAHISWSMSMTNGGSKRIGGVRLWLNAKISNFITIICTCSFPAQPDRPLWIWRALYIPLRLKLIHPMLQSRAPRAWPVLRQSQGFVP